MAELRIIGIDDTITCEDIVQTIVKISGCRVSEVRTGPIRIAGRGMGTVWVRCPLTAANKLAEMGKIKVGWFSARVEMLPGRKLHCFRCLRPGHAKGQCTAEEDFSNRCYNCSDIGHKLQVCINKSFCILCNKLGMQANHRPGSRICEVPPLPRRRLIISGTKEKRTGPGPTQLMETETELEL
ncbi:putative 50 kda protein in type i retrotransposable element r1dm [Lasius niger]|uniref:Putative 50 kDa protein in type i retrotransposable element r1dm n=1 Tax=Lasius niger TaxID=67767 RepID=A0A0J7MMJ9_LASNI|nr:putative 50 kda protein in type i retrotransposable element r1dm [Lasius niger]